MVVFVEAAIMDDPLLTKNPAFTPNIKEKLMTFTEGKDDLTDKVDFISKLLNFAGNLNSGRSYLITSVSDFKLNLPFV